MKMEKKDSLRGVSLTAGLKYSDGGSRVRQIRVYNMALCIAIYLYLGNQQNISTEQPHRN